mgnify:CR=1 FL=1
MASKYMDTVSIVQVIGGVYNNPQLLEMTDRYTITDEDFPDAFHRTVFGAIYKWVWINRTTKYLNIVKDSKKHNSGLEIILCMFVPFYTIYWTYQSALRIEKLCKEKKIEYMGDFVSVATVLEVLFTVISAIYMQNRINDICLKVKENDSNNSNSKNKTKNNDFDELREYKKLLDEEIITQEEFEKKKKELLNI